MLERKRKQMTPFDINDKPSNQQSKKRCCGISEYVTDIPGKQPMMKTCYSAPISVIPVYIPKNKVDISVPTIHPSPKSDDGQTEMDVDGGERKDARSPPGCHLRPEPHCSMCAAGQGGHISHLQS